jgi:hypothetical protein
MKLVLFLTLFLINIILGNIIVGRFNGVEKFEIQKEINQLESQLQRNPNLNQASKNLFSAKGLISLNVERPNRPSRGNARDSLFFRVIKGQIKITKGNQSYLLNAKDMLLIPPGGQPEIINNTANGFSSYYKLSFSGSTISNNDLTTDNFPSFLNIQKNNTKEFNLGKFYVYDKPEVNINEIANRLISQGVRLTSNLFAINEGISSTMFVLRGISGCHKHTRSDYISFNGLGGSYHKIAKPYEFDSFENDGVILVKDLDHNLISHKINDENEINVMLIFQFPAQSSSDSAPANNCTE